MTDADDARIAITSLAAATPYPMAKDRAEWAARMALLAVMPDGRTIAQHLDDGNVALRVLRALATPDPPAHCRWSANGMGDGR